MYSSSTVEVEYLFALCRFLV